jgi:hypothetical protein
VLTTEEIYSAYPDSSYQMSIKKALKDYYNGTYSDLEYALLGGDLPVVPSQECYVQRGIDFSYTPTDLFYACFDNRMDWNANMNDMYGEISDSIDYDPEITVSRLPVSTTAEVNVMVDRILSYEKNPGIENWTDSILMSGAWPYTFPVNGKRLSLAHIHCDSIYNGHIAPHCDWEKVRFYDTGTDFTGDDNFPLNATNLQNELQKGYNFLYMYSHGNANGWNLENGWYTCNNANSLQNPRFTIIVTSACNTNAIDSTCLSKSFMKNPDSGILAYYGSSRYGFVGTSKTNLGPSNIINCVLFDSLLINDDKCFAKAAQKAKRVQGANYENYGSYRWLLFSLNTLSDPEMPVYTGNPQQFTDVSISISGNTLLVDAGVDSCRITAMSMSDNGQSYYVVNDNVGYVSFDNIQDNCSVCITKPGYVPYIIEYWNVIFIQNVAITENRNIADKSIYVGSKVIHDNIGPVSIESGKTTLYGGAIIYNDLGVKYGAELEIK